MKVRDGTSKGTKYMLEYMKKLGKPVSLHITNKVSIAK